MSARRPGRCAVLVFSAQMGEVVDASGQSNHHVKVTIKVAGIVDTGAGVSLGTDWVVWDAAKTAQQHGQRGEYELRPVRITTRPVRFTRGRARQAPLPVFGSTYCPQERSSMRRRKDCERVVGRRRFTHVN